MKTASISELKDRLSAYVDLVRQGEIVVLTDRNRPVAQIVPLEPGTSESDASRLAELERKGMVRRARKPPMRSLAPPVRLPEGVSVLEALLEERHGGR
ncbi:MAG: type II toxin-antitoxin system prevent-host-death family antitoxin [Burkholderiales bacterium]|nr:type II toxin-antitoxin system prevent-host-death family antitoxin [Burkholderiales bacterium]